MDIGLVATIMDFVIPLCLYQALKSQLSTIVWLTFGLVIFIRVLIAADLNKST